MTSRRNLEASNSKYNSYKQHRFSSLCYGKSNLLLKSNFISGLCIAVSIIAIIPPSPHFLHLSTLSFIHDIKHLFLMNTKTKILSHLLSDLISSIFPEYNVKKMQKLLNRIDPLESRSYCNS